MSLKTQIIVVSCLFVVFAVLSLMSRLRLRRPPRPYQRRRRRPDSETIAESSAAAAAINSVDKNEQSPVAAVSGPAKGILIAALVVTLAAVTLVLVYD